MRQHTLAATADTIHCGFLDNSLPPVLSVESGDEVSLETMSLMEGQLKAGMDLEAIARARQTYSGRGVTGHTLTGPIQVAGAEPGNALEVRILRLLARPPGINYHMPGRVGSGTLPEEFPTGFVRAFHWEAGATEVDFGPGIRLPLRPFMGVMAVAPAEPGRISTQAPGPFGGNIDLKELVEGTTLFLPVFVPGALFSTGDAHALQGDGEVNSTAAETAMEEVRLRLTVRNDLVLTMPMAETATHWITMGFEPDLDEAARIALREAIAWLVLNKGLSRGEAYSLCSLAVDFRVTQLVDRRKGIHAMIPKAIFKE